MVGDLLRQSMSAHDRAKDQRRRGNRDQARESLLQARALRLQALAEDPERTDIAWAAEQARTPLGRDTHDELLKFYREQLGDL